MKKKKVQKRTKPREKQEKSCRQPSNKDKNSKVKKLIALAEKNPKPEKKKGFFSRLFGK
jgi:hypothetical protein